MGHPDADEDPPSQGDAVSALHPSSAAPAVSEAELLRVVIDLIPAFIYAKDVHSRFIVCNRFTARAMGTTPAQAIGKTDFDFYPAQMAARFRADESVVMESGKAVIDREESAIDQSTGTVRSLLTSKVPLRDARGAVVGVVGTGRDITERKEAERRLAAAGRLQSIGNLAAGIAHEINTPVQYVGDSVYFVEHAVSVLLDHIDRVRTCGPATRATDPELAELKRELPAAIRRIKDGLDRITEIVQSMKEFSHPEQSQMSGADLNRLVQNTLVVARNEYKYVSDVKIELGDLPLVTCFAGHINQVILNLIVNAAHAIADQVERSGGRGLITIRTYVEDGHAVLRIDDTGTGIPDDIRDHIFDPFFSTKEVGRGMGQGLSICRSIVVQGHGGSLTFDTEVGKGTTFYVRLPIDRAADPG